MCWPMTFSSALTWVGLPAAAPKMIGAAGGGGLPGRLQGPGGDDGAGEEDGGGREHGLAERAHQ